MGELLVLLIFPAIWPFISKMIWSREITWGEMAIQFVVVCGLVAGVYQLGKMSKTDDTEIHNGQVTAKNRVHGEYTESYSCHCHQSCSGSGKNRSCSTVCQTCYREHYTVKWYLDSSIGRIGIDSRDWTSPAVYALPNPNEYERAYIGEPCSGEFAFTNYVKAVPESLFGMISKTSQQKFVSNIPSYPSVVNIYHINRIINVGSNLNPNTLSKFNDQLNEQNKLLGPTKQANIIVIVTSITDPMYRYAVENAWLGGKKNDVVVFIGSKDGIKIDWTDVMTWAMNKGNGEFHSALRDDILKVGTLNPDQLVPVISSDVTKLYSRPHMKDFQYLEKEIRPPTWVLITALILGIVLSITATFVFWRMEHEYEYMYGRGSGFGSFLDFLTNRFKR